MSFLTKLVGIRGITGKHQKPGSQFNNAAFLGLLTVFLAFPANLLAHGTENHDSGVSVDVKKPADQPNNINNLPNEIANIGGPFSLVNHMGESVTDKTYAGKHMLVFFGYSNCQIMCSISLKRIGDALALLHDDPETPLDKFYPLVITVDPENDTPRKLRESLSVYHSRLIGLTGSLEQLKPVYSAYGQNPSILEMDLNSNQVVSHTSYFYLMGPNGHLQTFFPPVLNAESMAGIIKKYVGNEPAN